MVLGFAVFVVKNLKILVFYFQNEGETLSENGNKNSSNQELEFAGGANKQGMYLENNLK